MSTNFVHLVCLFFAVFCLASLHRAHPMEVKTDLPQKDEPMNITKVHTVHGDQVLDKKRESVAPLNDSETVREPRMSVINGVAISKSGRVFPQVRGLLSETETNHSRRGANIETNNVYGNQVFNKKRENMAASNESETAHDPRMVVIEKQVIRGGQVFRPFREAISAENETLSRRGANIETNNVYGNQVFNKKRENMAALNESETFPNRRFTVIGFNDVRGDQIIGGKRETMEPKDKEGMTQSRRGANIETNNVYGNQVFNKKRENMAASNESETIRNRRLTVIHHNDVRGHQIIRGKRETMEPKDKEGMTQSRRGANIETNNVYGNQVFNKKRENMPASNESETVHNRRMTVISNTYYDGYYARPSTFVYSDPRFSYAGVSSRPVQSYALAQTWANRMTDPAWYIRNSVLLPSVSTYNTQSASLSAYPGYIKQLTVNGDQYLSKKKRRSVK